MADSAQPIAATGPLPAAANAADPARSRRIAAEAAALAGRFHPPPPARRVFCNRTLNLRAIKTIGYDMDYTLIHYHVRQWEGRAYAHLQQRLLAQGWPIADLAFDPDRAMRGLVIDKQLGNLCKTNRFGYVKAACHGTRSLTLEELRTAYRDTLVDLADTDRYVFLNTLFEISEGCMYAQLVDLVDRRAAPELLAYPDLYRKVRYTLDRAHVEGELKAEILAHPERYVDLDPQLPLTLLDQRESGKKLMLITNSEWSYTNAMMGYAFNRFLPAGQTWRDLFKVVVVSARKPAFFHSAQQMMFEVVDEDAGLLRPVESGLREGAVYFGGSAQRVEKALGLDGDQILYVGDHMLADVHQSKKLLQWRTALILREIEAEMEATVAWRDRQAAIEAKMAEKERLEFAFSQYRVRRQRERMTYATPMLTGDEPAEVRPATDPLPSRDRAEPMNILRERLVELDAEIAPLVGQAGQLHNPYWGLMMRAGNDKSLFARLVEQHADVYTSRVSNFCVETPFVFLRSLRGSLPHDA
ncbi:MAG: HAD family hydrolase [Myxococcales bacterium]|nr:HAD family hydrolase [Myxococcales bacterium]